MSKTEAKTSKICEKLQQIEELQKIETPWTTHRFIGKLRLHGNQIYLDETDELDFGSLEEFREAVTWIVEQLGGTVKWNTGKK